MPEQSSQHSIPYINATTYKDVIQKNRSSFFSSFKSLNTEKRTALMTVYTFFRIADDCVDDLPQKNDKIYALQYWECQLKEMYEGHPQHPLMQELYQVVQKYNIPHEYLQGLIDGCKMDIQKNRYQTFDELYEYCYKVAGLVGLTCMKIFGYESPTANETAVNLGLAFQLTNIIRDVSGDLQMNRIYIPQDLMQVHGYSESELKNKKYNPEFIKTMDGLANKAQTYFKKALQEFNKDKNNELIAAKIMAEVYYKILQNLMQQNYPVFDKKISVGFFTKLKIALRLFLFKR